MAPQVYLVTGANKGIGYEVVRILSERLGDQAIILLGTRSLDNGKAAIAKMQQANPSFNYANVYSLEIDVTKSESIQAAAEFVKATYGTLHALINNAGITAYVEGVDACFNVNVFGVHKTLSAFHSIMVPNQSINIVVASEVGAWTFSTLSPELQAIFANYSAIDIPTLRELANDWKASNEGKSSKQTWPTVGKIFGPYGVSKTMVLALTRKWAQDHADMKTMMVCPGHCATDLNKHSGPRSPVQGGESVVFPIFHSEETKTGGFYRDGVEHGFNVPMPAQFQ
ncbi:hypothetical protein LEN26_016668 [Aphanomyces euteiches]|nr:hypothetical protein LEN26_016668 [Aphanomyces euteiches]KAH9114980.1 hypothetical protein AeMF1_010966 [Aphanomyces euteiches]KAH9195934.1 hypothetical protein AeNC1_002083 [Aphanomyces euteiches]